MTTTSPAAMVCPVTAAMAASSESNTRAGPECSRRVVALTLTTAPSGARPPRKMPSPASVAIGLAAEPITVWFARSCPAFASSARDLPVTVAVLPSTHPPSIRRCASRREPPAACMSTAVKRPDGLRSARTGTSRLSRSKSSSASGTPASWAIASRCRTALVDPPVAATDRIALAKAWGVKSGRGRRFAVATSSASAPMASA